MNRGGPIGNWPSPPAGLYHSTIFVLAIVRNGLSRGLG
jgi:hypothetical protein